MATLLNSLKELFNSKFGKIKLTTRITIFNVILFTLLICFVFIFVSILTRQFLFYKNKEELTSKQIQIEDFINDEIHRLYQTPKNKRVEYVYNKLNQLFLFKNYQFVILVSDSDNNNSYSLNKSYYDIFVLGDEYSSNTKFEIGLSHATINNDSYLDFSLYGKANGDVLDLIEATRIPLKLTAHPDVFLTKILGTDVVHGTSEFSFLDGSKIYVTLFLTSSLDSDYLNSLNSALFVSGAICILLLSIFGRYFTRRALKPLVKLSYTAQNINNETLDYRIESTGSDDEVDTLIKSLNYMLQNLEKSFEYQKRFVSDASHELRIPLTIILGYIELLKATGNSDEELVLESMDAIESEARNMKSLVEKLLLLARVENRSFNVNFDRLSVESIGERLISECQLLYPDFTFELKLDYKDEILADMELLIQIFRAIIENAVKYSEKPCVITFTSKELRKHYEVSIIDSGRGIPPEDLKLITNRFYRVDEDRNRKTGGVGLGLAIVDSLMKVQGGKINIESEIGIGTKISLLFPKDSFMKS